MDAIKGQRVLATRPIFDDARKCVVPAGEQGRVTGTNTGFIRVVFDAGPWLWVSKWDLKPLIVETEYDNPRDGLPDLI